MCIWLFLNNYFVYNNCVNIKRIINKQLFISAQDIISTFIKEFELLFIPCSYVWIVCTSSPVKFADNLDQSIKIPTLTFTTSLNEDNDEFIRIIKIIPRLQCNIVYQNEISVDYFISVLGNSDKQFVYLFKDDENNSNEFKNNQLLAYTTMQEIRAKLFSKKI